MFGNRPMVATLASASFAIMKGMVIRPPLRLCGCGSSSTAA
uniref:Uncharacterized protein n=1 Tax=Lotus japonicus TaxID=34305 RepID=I3SZQ8_LOTJA|nr:unknown [Lotus japonicus]